VALKYYKYEDLEANHIGGGIRYVEADGNISLREVTIQNDLIIGSNIKYPGMPPLLSDAGGADYDSIDEVQRIDKQEFDQVWQRHLMNNAGRWTITKFVYPVGKKIAGRIAIFYPQGVIVDLGDAVLGLADYQSCKQSTIPAYMYTGHLITAIISNYEEQNQWLILESPQIYSDRKDMYPTIGR
jgi:hypothetical protein